jgi:transposase
VAEVLGDASATELTPMLRQVIHDLYDEWLWIDGRLTEIDRQLVMLCRQIEAARRIATIPGIGPATATASDGSAFGRGRDFAAWLGLVPTSAEHRRSFPAPRHQQARQQLSALPVHPLRGISTPRARSRTERARPLGRKARKTGHCNVMLVALAAKLARITWSVLWHGSEFDLRLACTLRHRDHHTNRRDLQPRLDDRTV